jgi:putative transposase
MSTTTDVVVIGSGFGGTVSALRLTEKGYGLACWRLLGQAEALIPALGLEPRPPRHDSRMRPAPRSGAHCLYLLHLHLVFCVKYRRKALTAPMLARLQDGTARMLAALGREPIELSGERDHVHFLIAHPPHMPVSEITRRLKGRSAHVSRREFPQLQRVCRNHLRSPSYFAASVGGAPIDVLRRYIESQDRPTS